MIHLKKPISIVRGLTLLLLLPLCQVATFLPEAIGQERRETKSEEASAVAEVKKGPATPPYTVIAERNLFSPERKEFPLMTQPPPPGEVKKPPARPNVILYGVTLAGDYESASIVQPGRPLRKGEREMLTLKVGEKIGGYELKKILPDRITLEGEGDSFEVLLYDSAKPKARTAVRTEIRPATVTSTVPGPTPVEPLRPSIPGTPASETPRPTVPPPVPGQERATLPPMPTPGAPAAITPSPTPLPQPATPSPSPSPVFPPRRRVPITPGMPSPETTVPQPTPRESEGSP